MQITDKGLEQILSLGLMRPTDFPGVYYLYTWKSVDYYCGSALSKSNLAKDGVYISLSESQFKALPLQETKGSINPELLKVSKYFQTAVHLKYDADANCLTTQNFSGQNNNVVALKIHTDKPSPFTLVKETSKEFHGYFSKIEPCTVQLENAYIKTDNLWISACPIFKNKNFTGIIVGFSNDKDYGSDVLKILNEFALKVS